MYLQGVRSGSLAKISSTGDPEDTAAAKNYYAMLWKYKGQLASEVPEPPVTAIVSPPSRFPQHAEPYRLAIRDRFRGVLDLTDRFCRSGNVHSGEDASFDDICAALTYRTENDEAIISSLLIVDDVFSRGRTAAAMVLKLRASGLAISSPVTVAFPLWLPRGPE
jgi:hypothetical protein